MAGLARKRMDRGSGDRALAEKVITLVEVSKNFMYRLRIMAPVDITIDCILSDT
jgi:hypothetical protein